MHGEEEPEPAPAQQSWYTWIRSRCSWSKATPQKRGMEEDEEGEDYVPSEADEDEADVAMEDDVDESTLQEELTVLREDMCQPVWFLLEFWHKPSQVYDGLARADPIGCSSHLERGQFELRPKGGGLIKVLCPGDWPFRGVVQLLPDARIVPTSNGEVLGHTRTEMEELHDPPNVMLFPVDLHHCATFGLESGYGGGGPSSPTDDEDSVILKEGDVIVHVETGANYDGEGGTTHVLLRPRIVCR